jgi:tetratricopeptide (TPR) repeat protein
VWKKKFKMTLFERHREKNLTISVYDMDALVRGDFLGQVVISAKELMFPSPDTQVRKLERNPALGKKGNKLVQGSLRFAAHRLFSEANTRRWNLLRSQVKVAARTQYKEELIKDPENVEMLAKMGMLCSQGGTVNLARCAAVLLTIAADKGYPGDGKFWKSLASTHLRTWLAEGLRAERLHLEKSCDAYEEALKFMENAIDVECWISAAYTNQLLGRSERAAQTLGTIIKKFPNYKYMARISLQSAIILAHLGRYDQSARYMDQCIEVGDPPNPYVDCCFRSCRSCPP